MIQAVPQLAKKATSNKAIAADCQGRRKPRAEEESWLMVIPWCTRLACTGYVAREPRAPRWFAQAILHGGKWPARNAGGQAARNRAPGGDSKRRGRNSRQSLTGGDGGPLIAGGTAGCDPKSHDFGYLERLVVRSLATSATSRCLTRPLPALLAADAAPSSGG